MSSVSRFTSIAIGLFLLIGENPSRFDPRDSHNLAVRLELLDLIFADDEVFWFQDSVVAIEMVMPDGKIRRFGDGTGFAPGYDLVGAITGSEGTLGIVTEATVKLLQVPEGVETLLGIFPDVIAACRAVRDIVCSGLVPAAQLLMGCIRVPENAASLAAYLRSPEVGVATHVPR